MYRTYSLIAVLLLAFAACSKGSDQPEPPPQEGESTEQTESSTEATEQSEQTTEEQTEQVETPPADEAFEGVRDGYFESTRFNIRFVMPQGWESVPTSDDSVTLAGADGLQAVVANTQSVQLANTSFDTVNDRVSFDQVNIVPDRTITRPINGLPGYRVEGDALLRNENVPIYFISQAVSVPGDPVMMTIYVPGDYYDLHSDTMKAVLDSIEALEIRPQ